MVTQNKIKSTKILRLVILLTKDIQFHLTIKDKKNFNRA